MHPPTAHATSCHSDEGHDLAQDSQDPGRKKKNNALDSLPALTGLRLGVDASVGPSCKNLDETLAVKETRQPVAHTAYLAYPKWGSFQPTLGPLGFAGDLVDCGECFSCWLFQCVGKTVKTTTLHHRFFAHAKDIYLSSHVHSVRSSSQYNFSLILFATSLIEMTSSTLGSLKGNQSRHDGLKKSPREAYLGLRTRSRKSGSGTRRQALRHTNSIQAKDIIDLTFQMAKKDISKTFLIEFILHVAIRFARVA
ncbi:hypothetical protein GJ744_001275 [Endocarpon pusillum]|uniref:Uncharacterized protein n=1 Tax=Endocarpon pusillum TaxID=364733 RepID=A0A8H7ADE4_9EURO|nr:hypothetical protein GJ744_001275 [Endocarpon pusillum]